MTSEQKKAIDACKDQAAKELSKGFWKRWDDFIHDARNRVDWVTMFVKYSDRAMQIYGEQCRKEGYEDGKASLYDDGISYPGGRGVAEC